MKNVVKTSDRIDVVRCRDCKHAHMTMDGEVKYCDNEVFQDELGNTLTLYVPGNWYCAYGERKDDA